MNGPRGKVYDFTDETVYQRECDDSNVLLIKANFPKDRQSAGSAIFDLTVFLILVLFIDEVYNYELVLDY